MAACLAANFGLQFLAFLHQAVGLFLYRFLKLPIVFAIRLIPAAVRLWKPHILRPCYTFSAQNRYLIVDDRYIFHFSRPFCQYPQVLEVIDQEGFIAAIVLAQYIPALFKFFPAAFRLPPSIMLCRDGSGRLPASRFVLFFWQSQRLLRPILLPCQTALPLCRRLPGQYTGKRVPCRKQGASCSSSCCILLSGPTTPG